MRSIGNYVGLVALAAAMTITGEVKAQFISAGNENTGTLKTADSSRLQDASRMGRTSGAKAAAFQELYDYETSHKNLTDEIFPYQRLLHKAYCADARRTAHHHAAGSESYFRRAGNSRPAGGSRSLPAPVSPL
ncbi:hypothetical protein [Chitinophaga solisilvae]|uniref:hypothetical protein n=1 Tax=Chitinophaga solisilvae TaxID=1233460 RepID=UPI001368CFA1|nr:hypothetical protein [Chitinophaga solisilvae]